MKRDEFREAAWEIEHFTMDELREKVGEDTLSESAATKHIQRGLRERWLIREYRYVGDKPERRGLTSFEKIWQFIRINRRFTRREVQVFAGTSKGYTQKVIAFLKKNGFVEKLGSRPCPNCLNVMEPVYGLEKDQVKAPKGFWAARKSKKS